MATPSRATVITASVAIGVFGAGTGVGAIISADSYSTETQVTRLAAGTYRLDDQTEAWTPSEGAQPVSLSGSDSGSTITTGSREKRICLTTTTDGRAIKASGKDCTPLPVLATGASVARRPGDPGNSPAARPESSSPVRETSARRPLPSPSDPEPTSRSGTSSKPLPITSSTPHPSPSPATTPSSSTMIKPDSGTTVTTDYGPSLKPDSGTKGVTPSPTSRPWAKVLSRLADGSKLIERRDGSRAILTPDGRVIRVVPGPWAEITTVLQNGNWLMIRPNGDRVIITSEGVEIADPGQTPPAKPPASHPEPTASLIDPTPRPVETTARPVPTATPLVEPTVRPIKPTASHPEPTASLIDPTPRPVKTPVPETTARPVPTATPSGESILPSVQPTPSDVEPTASIVEPTAPSGGSVIAHEPAPIVDENVLKAATDASLPVFKDQALLERAYKALGLDKGMRYTDANGEWDLNIAPPGTPACRDYSAAELRALTATQNAGGPQAAIPRDSCTLPAFVRWLYADAAPGQVSNWTKFTGLPQRNLDLVVTNPATMPPAQPDPGQPDPGQIDSHQPDSDQIDPDAFGYAGS